MALFYVFIIAGKLFCWLKSDDFWRYHNSLSVKYLLLENLWSGGDEGKAQLSVLMQASIRTPHDTAILWIKEN